MVVGGSRTHRGGMYEFQDVCSWWCRCNVGCHFEKSRSVVLGGEEDVRFDASFTRLYTVLSSNGDKHATASVSPLPIQRLSVPGLFHVEVEGEILVDPAM